MEIIEFNLKQQDYIELASLLKHLGIVQTGGQVKILLAQNLIIYNGEIEFRKKKKLFEKDEIIISQETKIKIIKK